MSHRKRKTFRLKPEWLTSEYQREPRTEMLTYLHTVK